MTQETYTAEAACSSKIKFPSVINHVYLRNQLRVLYKRVHWCSDSQLSLIKWRPVLKEISPVTREAEDKTGRDMLVPWDTDKCEVVATYRRVVQFPLFLYLYEKSVYSGNSHR